MILIFILAILVLCFFYGKHKKSYYSVDKTVKDKVIWTYWDNPYKVPKIVKMCIQGWKKQNPEYNIILLTKNNYHEYVYIPENVVKHPNFNDIPARFADLVRIYTLAKYGGVWCDASIIMNEPLRKWLYTRNAEFSGFYIGSFTVDNRYPVIENWFFACNKNSKFVKKWRDEFINLSRYPTIDDYVKSRMNMGVNLQKIDNPKYLAMHVSAQKILQIDKYPLENLILRKAEDGPFKYLTENDWYSEKALNNACNNDKYQSIIKLRSHERIFLEKNIDKKLSNKKCKWIK